MFISETDAKQILFRTFAVCKRIFEKILLIKIEGQMCWIVCSRFFFWLFNAYVGEFTPYLDPLRSYEKPKRQLCTPRRGTRNDLVLLERTLTPMWTTFFEAKRYGNILSPFCLELWIKLEVSFNLLRNAISKVVARRMYGDALNVARRRRKNLVIYW